MECSGLAETLDHELILREINNFKREIEIRLATSHITVFTGDGNHFPLAKVYSTLLSLENASRLALGIAPNTYTPPWVIYEHEQHSERMKVIRDNARSKRDRTS